MRSTSVVAVLLLLGLVSAGCADESGLHLVDTAAPTTTTAAPSTTAPDAPTGPAPAVDVPFWNGHDAAVTWSFDDGFASHLDRVVPFLDERGIPATFYPTCNLIAFDAERWAAASDRHEVANHTMSHAVAGPDTDVEEIAGCDVVLRETVGVEPLTFAYTNGVVDQPYLGYSQDHHVAARGTWSFQPYVLPGDELDFHDLPGVALGEVDASTPPEERLGRPLGALADAIDLGGWVTFVVHAIDEPGYARITFDEFASVVDAAEGADVWYATFADVTTHLWVARTISEPEWLDGEWHATWPVVSGMSGVPIRVEAPGGVVRQDGAAVATDDAGYALVDARLGGFSWSET